MRRIPLQGVLPLGRKQKVLDRQWRERASGKKVRRGPGRPKSKRPTGVSHQMRPVLGPKSVLHVSLKVTRGVPNLRTRRRYGVIKNAFVKFCAPKELGFRLIHFAVLSNHLHFVVEADNRRALALGMQKLLHSISRRLNALSLREHGQKQSTKAGAFRAIEGWLGRVFSDRYFAHLLKSPTEIGRALEYVRCNAKRHYADHRGIEPLRSTARGSSQGCVDPFSSFAPAEPGLTVAAKNILLLRADPSRQR